MPTKEIPLLLSFDCGTQSARAMLFDKQGNLVASATETFTPYFSTKIGYAEQHADFYYEKLCSACKTLLQLDAGYAGCIAGVTLTTMRDTMVCLDKNNKPLRPVILWMDTRRAEKLPPLPLIPKVGTTLLGMADTVKQTRAGIKSNWLQEHEPHIWEKTHKYVTISCYLTYKLTGVLIDSVASQVGHIPFWYPKKRWMKETHLQFSIFGVPTEKLSSIAPPGTVMGTITLQASSDSGIPVGKKFVASGADKGCESLGSGCCTPNTASISLGTASAVQVVTDRYIEPQRFMPAYPSVLPDKFNPEIQVFRGYWLVSWFKEQFGKEESAQAMRDGVAPEEILDEYIKTIPPGAEGLFVQPYWGGGLKMTSAKGSILGFRDVHTRGHIYRAILEGINYALLEGMQMLEKRTHTRIGKVAVSGGGANSDLVCQLLSDMFGLPAVRAQTFETAGLGAAIIAFYGLGEFDSVEEAVGQMVHEQTVFMPNLELSKFYKEQYENTYKKIYKHVKPLYK